MKLKDYSALLLVGLSLGLFFFPWQIRFYDRWFEAGYQLVMILGCMLPLLYGFFRVKVLADLPKWTFRTGALIGLAYGVLQIWLLGNFLPPAQNTYMLLYSKPDTPSETVEIVHNHAFITNWNDIKHRLNFPQLGFCLDKEFEQDNLQGTWLVHEGNPYCEQTGVLVFKKGKVIASK